MWLFFPKYLGAGKPPRAKSDIVKYEPFLYAPKQSRASTRKFRLRLVRIYSTRYEAVFSIPNSELRIPNSALRLPTVACIGNSNKKQVFENYDIRTPHSELLIPNSAFASGSPLARGFFHFIKLLGGKASLCYRGFCFREAKIRNLVIAYSYNIINLVPVIIRIQGVG